MSLTRMSKLIAGTMTWGIWGEKFSKQEFVERMSHCFDHGITTFDHADIYGDYTTEAEFGEAFKSSGLNRSQVQFISKCGIQKKGDTRSETKVKHYNYSKDYIIWSVENSLKNLNTDYLDVLLLHRPSPLLEPTEAAKAIDVLKKDGKILNFGLSNFKPSQTKLISDYTEVSTNQIEFSLSQHDAMHNGDLDYMMSHQIKPMSWSPLGDYFKTKSENNQRVAIVFKDFCNKYNVTEDQLLLAWLLKHPAHISPVIGTTKLERITASTKALEINLELEDWFMILEAYQGFKVP